MIALLLGAPTLLAELELGRVPSLWATLALGYLGLGSVMAWHLSRNGHGLGTATSALACWPLLLGLINRPPPRGSLDDLELGPRAELGSKRAQIDACMRALAEGLAETVDADGRSPALIDARQLVSLRAALHRADARIARVDRLLRETEGARERVVDAGLDAALARLRGARDHARAELEAVLANLLQLRVQLGLFHLAGESEPVRERLVELESRLTALVELSAAELGEAPACAGEQAHGWGRS
jgi:hypothetical protein